MKPEPRDPDWPRYAPQVPFPGYRFIPGAEPHPRRDPKGHSYGQPDPKPPRLPPERWRENEAYLFGVDLYNFAYWWESHELWEALWHLTGHAGTEAQFLQGLIQVAAANIQRHLSKPDGPKRLAGEAVDRLRDVPETYMGLHVPGYIEAVRAYHLDHAPAPVPLIRLKV